MPRILVVDDESEIREVLGELLRGMGYEVVEARDGEEAVQIFNAEQIDAIILDIIMPRRDGLQCLIELTREYHDVRVIVISGGGKAQLKLARRFGAEYVFCKPFALDDLISAVKDLVERPARLFGPDQYLWRKKKVKKRRWRIDK